ncbi:MAG: tetratricopeptide repeat protein, partial [Acidobacteriota bacterium]
MPRPEPPPHLRRFLPRAVRGLSLAVLAAALVACGSPGPDAEASFDADAAAGGWLEKSADERSSRLDALKPAELERLAVALRTLGRTHEDDPTPDRAARAFEAARRAAERAGATVEVGLADFFLGRLYGQRGRYGDALGPLQSSVRHLRDAGDADQLGSALNGLGIVLRNLGHAEQATLIYREALELTDADTPARSVAGRLHNLGTAYWEMGDLDRALDILQQALERKRQLGDGARLCSTLLSMSNVRTDLGDEAQAEALLRACLDEPGRSGAQLSAVHNLGGLLRRRGQLDDAAELLEAGHAAAVAGGLADHTLNLTRALGTLELQRQNPERALALMDEALAAQGAASTSDDARAWVVIHMTRSHALRRLGRVDESLDSAERARRLAEAIDIPDVPSQAWHDLGR